MAGKPIKERQFFRIAYVCVADREIPGRLMNLVIQVRSVKYLD